MNRKSLLALLLSGLVLLTAGAAFVDAELSWMPDWIENNDLNFGGFSSFVGGAGGAGLTEAEMRAVIVALINAKFGEEDFLTVLRESNSTAADKLAALATANPTFQQQLAYINKYAKTSAGKEDLKKIQDQITDNKDSKTNDNVDKTKVIKDYQTKIDTGTVTAADKEKLIAALKSIGDTIITDPITGKTWAYSEYDSSDPKNTKGKNKIDTEAQFALDVGYDDCLDGFMAGGGNIGSPAGSGTNNGACSIYTYNDWGACSGGSQKRTIFTEGPAGCTDTSSAVLTQSCVDNSGTACTSYTYNTWGTCSAGSQSRTIASQLPSGCTNTSTAVLAQACSVVCTSYTYGNWSACAAGAQTRSMLSRVPSDCTDTSSAVFTQSCSAVEPPVVANTTNASQNSSSPVLSVTTDRPAACQFAEAGGFAYGNGTTFSTTGAYNHNSSLSNVNSGQHIFYVICKDNATGGMSAALKIEFKVDLSLDPANAPTVSNVTPAAQSGPNPVLAVTTDRPAICQYKKDAVFGYGSGTAIPTTDNYSHSASISSLANASYAFYVVCKDKTTDAVSSAKQILTTLDRENIAGAPVITNNTNSYQTVVNPVLAITTDKAAVCQYSASNFVYGNGTQFTTDGDISHSVQLSNLNDGQHAYYVICKGVASGVASAAGYQIIFSVSAGGINDGCADLSSNDRKSDGNRSNGGSSNGGSVYLWQSVEKGTRERFSKVDWYAGYQFTTEKDGQVNQLCGYFDSGTTNKVSVYNGSYSEIASAQVAGNGAWKCVDISPLAIKADNRYYVIARVQDNPIYFEYKSGLLPRDTGNAVIEAGIRQTIVDNKFKTDVVKYDYMIFGLVDVRISYASSDDSGPEITSVGPVGTVNSSSATLSAQTDRQSTCRYGREDVNYSQMSYVLPEVFKNNFSQKACGLENGNYTFYVRCKNSAGAENNTSKIIQFSVSQ